jgi:hypothetical protein
MASIHTSNLIRNISLLNNIINRIEEVMSNSKGLGKHGENSSARNEINISNIHVPIKPIASKQMPKCFRMSKH